MSTATHPTPDTLAHDAWDTAVPPDQLQPSPLNPRKTFDEAALAELAESIRRHGLLQPIVMRPAPDHVLNTYIIVAGERRWRKPRRRPCSGLCARRCCVRNWRASGATTATRSAAGTPAGRTGR